MKKFISDDDELKGEIDNMIGTSDLELIKALFPKEVADERNAGFNDGVIDVARNMKARGDKTSKISEVTGLSSEEIEEL